MKKPSVPARARRPCMYCQVCELSCRTLARDAARHCCTHCHHVTETDEPTNPPAPKGQGS